LPKGELPLNREKAFPISERERLHATVEEMDGDMRGRVCLVTGGSRGIGKAAAIELAVMGATVAIVARAPDRGAQALAEIRTRSGSNAVELFLADLSTSANVRRLAAEVRARYDALHVLINNAGAVNTKRTLTADGIESTFAVNHLAPFLLTASLRELLHASAPARVVTVSSEAHRGVILGPDNLQGERRYRGFGAYAQSKLENILFTYELARRLEGTGVTANCLHPGVVSTGFGKNDHGLLRLGMTLAGPFFLSPEQGADTVVHLASSPDVENVSGKYFIKRQPVASSPVSYDDVLAEWLWGVSERMTGWSR
jgi:retinol dehydrogenase-14